MGDDAYVSRSGKSRTKLEYVKNGRLLVKLWETGPKGVLETHFDGNGHILLQKALSIDGSEVDSRIAEVLDDAGILLTKEIAYSDVNFDKPCPNCGEYGLSRYAEAFSTKGEIPVMPLYYCSKCSVKSYYLTDEYLEYMVDNNRQMFTGDEISEMSSDKEKFMTELRSYIIRIFASKKVMCIK